MFCTALVVLYTLAHRPFPVCWVFWIWREYGAGTSVLCLCYWVGEVEVLDRWELVGPLIGTTVPGTLGKCRRHLAIAGSLEQGGLSDCRWCMCVLGHVGWLVINIVVVSIELRSRALFVVLRRGHLVVAVVGSVL